MANYVYVDVIIKGDNYNTMRKIGEIIMKYCDKSLKELLVDYEEPEIVGRHLDHRSHIDGCEIDTINNKIVLRLEQPWNTNVERLYNWAVKTDESIKLLFYTNYVDDGEYATNDTAFLEQHPDWYYEDIWGF